MIGIVLIIEPEYAPYLENYIRILEEEEKEFEVLYWKRFGENTQYPYKTIAYEQISSLNDTKMKKMRCFIGYKRFLKKQIKKYKKLIVLTTLPGMIMYQELLKYYKGNYIYDIRDYTYENIIGFKFFQKKIIENSAFTTISSPEFKKFLPKSNKYKVFNNFTIQEVKEGQDINVVSHNSNETIKIVFLGAVRHFEIDSKLINKLGNDTRYEIFFHGYGRDYERLKKYSEKYQNVYVTGKYLKKDKSKLLNKATIINGYYSEQDIENKYALSNKYYDSLFYKKPMWANPKVYVGRRSIENNLGISISLEDIEFNNRLFDELNNFDYDKFNKGILLETNKVLLENERLETSIRQFINNN